MGMLLVVVFHPRIEIGLQLLQRPIDLLSKRDPIELVQHSFMESLTDPVGLRMPSLRARVIDVLHGQVQFILLAMVTIVPKDSPCGLSIFQGSLRSDFSARNLSILAERVQSNFPIFILKPTENASFPNQSLGCTQNIAGVHYLLVMQR